MAPVGVSTKNYSLKKNETAPPRITIGSLSVGGKATFTCPQGFMIDGATEATCKGNGEWSAPMPLCKGIGQHLSMISKDRNA